MSFADFRRQLRTTPLAILSEEIPADLMTPASVFLALSGPSTGTAFLFESVEGGESVGRYSIIGADPVEEIHLSESGGVHRMGRRVRHFSSDGFPDLLRSRIPGGRPSEAEHTMGGLLGGWVGYFGYDAVRLFERLPRELPDTLGHPWVSLGLYECVVIFDHVRQTARATVTIRPDERDTVSLRKKYDRAQRQLGRVLRRLVSPQTLPRLEPASIRRVRCNTAKRAFLDGVKQVKRHIAQGDIFQGVLSQRFSVEGSLSPFAVYRRLRRTNPSPYMYYLKFSDLAIAGSSPETLVQKRGTKIMTRPIAGTRPRGKNPNDDQKNERSLLASPKENAEHVMLVDLGRNDLGRVCRPGTVDTEQFRAIDRYSHVMHMVSTVSGTARRGVDAFDVLAASFPAGTVSGAPKIRAMEIIESIEPDRRGIYAGCVGYIDWWGDMDVAITIRTAVMDQKGAHVQAGAGIVADSDPLREYRETQSKAAAPLAAIGGEWARGDRP